MLYTKQHHMTNPKPQSTEGRTCSRDGCEGSTEYPREYCTNACENKALREAARKVSERLESNGE